MRHRSQAEPRPRESPTRLRSPNPRPVPLEFTDRHAGAGNRRLSRIAERVQRKRANAGRIGQYLQETSTGADLQETETHYEQSRASGEKIKNAYEMWRVAVVAETRQDDKGTGASIAAGEYRTRKAQLADRRVKIATGRGAGKPTDATFGDPYPADYSNYYDPTTRTFEAGYNMRDDDRNRTISDRPGVPSRWGPSGAFIAGQPAQTHVPTPALQNSEIIWFQYKQALAEAGMQKADKRGNLARIARTTIINKRTNDTIFWCDQGDQAMLDGGAFTVREGDEDFWALLGSPNGSASAWLLIQHGVSLGARGIDAITYRKKELQIDYELE